MFFSSIMQTMLTVQNYANMSVRTKYLLSHKAKKPFLALIVLTLHQHKCKRQQLIFHSHANYNHQRAFVLPSQESVINTNYISTVCEVSHTMWEAPEDALQHRIVSTYFIGQPLTTSIIYLVPGLKCAMACNNVGTFAYASLQSPHKSANTCSFALQALQ
jgi:hypothetical protein